VRECMRACRALLSTYDRLSRWIEQVKRLYANSRWISTDQAVTASRQERRDKSDTPTLLSRATWQTLLPVGMAY
jgi:hypothetical protein